MVSGLEEQKQQNSGALRYKKHLIDKKKRKRKHKYHNQKVVVNDIKFDSKKEANRYLVLLDQFANGKIKNLELQPRFKFPMGFSYYADFKYVDVKENKVIVEDTKGGYRNDVYKLKKKCFIHFYPKLELREV